MVMLKLGANAANIGSFTDLTELVLSETAKYLLLLLFAVLAIRLWRRLPKLSVQNRRSNSLLACLSTAIACAIGYFSVCHSLSRLYLYYGTRAFNSGYLLSAYSLFEKSSEYWKSADALGKKGVCLLLSGKADAGLKLIDEAKVLRKGQNSSFEGFYEGLYFFFQEQPNKAIPLLEKSSTDAAYAWNVTKLFAALYVDNNQPKDAERLMEPFAQVQVTEGDHAYVVASLDLFEGKKTEAKILVDKFDSDNLPPFWKSRFDKLRATIQSQNP
jgi:tetratricopeptide (TPR) repeat protein